MPQIIYTEQANRDLVRFAEFMQEREPGQKQEAILTLLDGIEILHRFPKIARTSQDDRYKAMRELFIAYGSAGYVVLYEHHEENDIVLINSIRHTREAGYKWGQ